MIINKLEKLTSGATRLMKTNLVQFKSRGVVVKNLR